MGPGATNNLELFSTEEFQIICTLGIAPPPTGGGGAPRTYPEPVPPSNGGPWATNNLALISTEAVQIIWSLGIILPPPYRVGANCGYPRHVSGRDIRRVQGLWNSSVLERARSVGARRPPVVGGPGPR